MGRGDLPPHGMGPLLVRKSFGGSGQTSLGAVGLFFSGSLNRTGASRVIVRVK